MPIDGYYRMRVKRDKWDILFLQYIVMQLILLEPIKLFFNDIHFFLFDII